MATADTPTANNNTPMNNNSFLIFFDLL